MGGACLAASEGECLRGGRVWVGRLAGSRAPTAVSVPRIPTTERRSTAATPSTHIEACMTMSVRRRRATLTALVSHPSEFNPSRLTLVDVLEDPNLAWQVRGGGRVWHLAIARGSSRRQWGGMVQRLKSAQNHTLRAKIRNPAQGSGGSSLPAAACHMLTHLSTTTQLSYASPSVCLSFGD